MKQLLLLGVITVCSAQATLFNARDYQFGYDTRDQLGPAKLFHQEKREGDDGITGRYGYVDARGSLRVVTYKAGPGGFEIVSDTEAETGRSASQLAADELDAPVVDIWSLRSNWGLLYGPQRPSVFPRTQPKNFFQRRFFSHGHRRQAFDDVWCLFPGYHY